MYIYADFSGYTDIAIGLGMLMGFRLHQNFNSPYKATSVADFWRRWHMSLSSWLRDYLYIPLGGNRRGSWGSYICIAIILLFIVAFTGMVSLLFIFMALAIVFWCLAYYFPRFKNFITTDINLLITMILGGLWHGPSINFLKWGALNGVGLVVYKYWRKISPYEKNNSWAVHFWKIFLTFNFITFTRIFFIVQDPEKSQQVIDQIFGNFFGDGAKIPDTALAQMLNYGQSANWDSIYNSIMWFLPALIVMTVAFIIHWLPTRIKEGYTNAYTDLHPAVQVAVIAMIVILMQQISLDVRVPFSYTQF